MGKRYSFELFYPVTRVSEALIALNGARPTARRGRQHAPAVDLSQLSPESPVFAELAMLLPADAVARWYADPFDELKPEWTDAGLECLPIGIIDLAVRVGGEYVLFSYTARTNSISLIFEEPTV